MPTELQQHIDAIRICNTHEHQIKERQWTGQEKMPEHAAPPRDVLMDLFAPFYQLSDLLSTGATWDHVSRAVHSTDWPLDERWAQIAPLWDAIRFTGYGEGVRLQAKLLYGIEEINAKSLAAAQPRLDAYKKPGQRLHLLRDVAKQDHVQVDDFVHACEPDAAGPDFFLYDISWVDFANANINAAALEKETGVTVTNLASLRRAMQAIFDRNAPVAVAVKSQHAYNRTLRWRNRTDSEAAAALQVMLSAPETADEATRLCLGDWCIARGAELCAEFNLPFKIHTGHYAGNGYMRTDRISAENLCELFATFKQTRFVLMHISYPFQIQLTSIIKHFPNTYADLCWAWSIDPYSSMDFVRRFIHAVPINKLFGFGGDAFWPTVGVAYAAQARLWLGRTLQAEVDDKHLSPRDAKHIADRLLSLNQREAFDLEGKRGAIAAKLARK